MILTYPTQLIPFASWLLMGYFRTIPKEIEESAMADGCSRIQILVSHGFAPVRPGPPFGRNFLFHPLLE